MKRIYHIINIMALLLLFFTEQKALAQELAIKGIVKDAAGQPVEGLLITVKENSTVTAFTDQNGEFIIHGETGHHIEINAYQKTQLVKINGNEISVTLDHGSEMIPLGFGQSRRKEEMTASVSKVDGRELTRISVQNPVEALYGKLSGLTVLQNGGESWSSNPDLFIRGRETFRDASLLVLIDGFERPLSSISLEEIENIVVLKDAAALAIYGQRGANGVMLVTTKRGRYNSFSVESSYSHSVTEPTRLPRFLSAPDYARAINQARINDGDAPLYSASQIETYESGSSPYFYPNVNWYDEALNDRGSRRDFNATFSGGGSNVTYLAVLNYQDEEGLYKPVDSNEGYSTQLKYGRLNYRTNLDIDLTKSSLLKVNFAGNLINNRRPGAQSGQLFNALYSTPSALFPVRTFDGVYGGNHIYGNNPVALIEGTGYSTSHSRELLFDAGIRQSLDAFAKGLSAEIAVASDNYVSYWDGKNRNFLYEAVSPVLDGVGTVVDTLISQYGQDTQLSYYNNLGNQRRHATLRANLNYFKSIGDNELNLLFGFQEDKLVKKGQYNVFLNQNLYGTLHYGIAQKYFIDAAISYAGSNMLPDRERFGFFPSLSAAWLLSKEGFLSGSKTVTNLKLRASWGITGSNLIPQNLYRQSYNSSGGSYYFTDNNTGFSGFSEGRLITENVTYESSAKSNIGLDGMLFDNLSFSFDVFYARRQNILANANGIYSDVVGVPDPLTSIGVVDNKGFELDLRWSDQIGQVNYFVDGMLSFARNEIIEMSEEYKPYDYLKETGGRIGQHFGLQAIGFFEDDAEIASSPKQEFSEVRPGDIKYKDQNNDGLIDAFDQVPVGYSSLPEMYFGAALGAEFKGFGFSAVVQGIKNKSVYLNTQSVYRPFVANNNVSEEAFKNSWTPETAGSAIWPRLTMKDNDNNYRQNDIWIADGSYIKLRNVDVYYDLKSSALENLKVNKLRFFARGNNLLSIDKIDILDPENLGVNYPIMRSYSVGVNVGF